ncbi:RimJ/RimL family protein N-acetyltransferase [Roseinatronobacter thiooxidans]|uniref:RimJ/RimL family protein N-acetyltransferase n=1 Tax=Roseinatronobacter thiooxidans TaxID=121821 RepID=A0A2W7RRF9_9RHOB|nr:GNAT family N-acetyltransferase [Roseinatronobacter thiooxidans]PZX40652.1 RimJ/RimL family protein N-acetyltransferase [Roseinatronobacter thiooxidans]
MTPVCGPNLRLRLIEETDASYVHTLRLDPTYNTHLSSVTGSVEDQVAWIRAYKAREDVGQEYYFVIERHDATRCGTVRLYDISGDSFTWGSWILDENKPAKAALESAILSFSFGFEGLGLSQACVDVRIANTHAEAFYRRLGMVETERDEQDIYFTYARSRFDADRAGFLAVLKGESER